MIESHSLFVSCDDDQGWSVRHHRGGKVLGQYPSRREAEAAARKTVAAFGKGEVCVEVLPSAAKSQD